MGVRELDVVWFLGPGLPIESWGPVPVVSTLGGGEVVVDDRKTSCR